MFYQYFLKLSIVLVEFYNLLLLFIAADLIQLIRKHRLYFLNAKAAAVRASIFTTLFAIANVVEVVGAQSFDAAIKYH
jgi:hypothetical protein